MAGHPLLNQVRAKSEAIAIDGETFHIVLSYNKVVGIEGYVIGLKFTDASGSMDSSSAKSVNGIRLSMAVAHRAVQMLKPDLDKIAILGFYLLTEDLEDLRPGGAKAKIRLYRAQAFTMHEEFQDKLEHLTSFEVQGGTAWVMSKNHYSAYDQFALLEKELRDIAKEMRVTVC